MDLNVTDFESEIAETRWKARQASMNLAECLASLRYKDSKHYRPVSEYLPEALEHAENQLAEALEHVKKFRQECLWENKEIDEICWNQKTT